MLGSLTSGKPGRNIRRFTMTAPSNQGVEYLLIMMRAVARGLQSIDLILKWRVFGSAAHARGSKVGESRGAKGAASASRPSWRVRLRRAAAQRSSKPAIARGTQAEFTDLANTSSSL